MQYTPYGVLVWSIAVQLLVLGAGLSAETLTFRSMQSAQMLRTRSCNNNREPPINAHGVLRNYRPRSRY